MNVRSLRLLCGTLLAIVWAVDVVSPQLFVVAILLTAPIALSTMIGDARFTTRLVIFAVLADATTAWFNAYSDGFHWNALAVGDRLLAALGILLVGIVSLYAQRAVRRASDLAERHARSEVMRDLIYALSHDLRTPLAAAGMTMRQALSGAYGELPPDYREILERSVTSNEELTRLADTLLTVARYESGEQSHRREPVNFSAICSAVVKEMTSLFESKRITVHAEIDTVPVMVLGDESELRRAVTNLVANAVAWTPQHGEVSIAAGRVAGDAYLTVKDNGYGVPAGMREQLFERFVGRARHGAGSGLGLYIVRRIAESHSGTVRYEPGNPSGSVFTLTVPLSAEALR